MRALVYHGPGQISWDSVPDPAIADPADTVVRIEATTVCCSICTSCAETCPR